MKRFAPKNILIGLIRLYQKLRPAGTRGCCKYIPTCSQYGLEAVERFGALKGGLLALCCAATRFQAAVRTTYTKKRTRFDPGRI